MAGAAVANLLAPNSILLVGVRQGNKSGRLDVNSGSRGSIELARPNRKLDITDPKGRTSWIMRGGICVFTRPAQEKESNKRHIHDGQLLN